MTLEQYSTASDGTALHWEISLPEGDGQVPFVVGIHGGGFWKGGMEVAIGVCGPDLVAAGFGIVSPEYRLVLPGSLAGQTSSGCFPDQTNDLTLAIEASRSHPRSSGSVQTVGGSAGACMSAWFAAIGAASGVCMSPVTQLDAIGNSNFTADCNNYAPGQLIEASPNTYVTSASKPVFVRSYAIDQLPASQYSTYVAALEAAGVEHDAALLPGKGHSFKMWPIVKDPAIAWLLAHI